MRKKRRSAVPELGAGAFDAPDEMVASKAPAAPKETTPARMGRPQRHATSGKFMTTTVRLSQENLEWLDQAVLGLKAVDRGVTRSEVVRTMCETLNALGSRATFTVAAKGEVHLKIKPNQEADPTQIDLEEEMSE